MLKIELTVHHLAPLRPKFSLLKLVCNPATNSSSLLPTRSKRPYCGGAGPGSAISCSSSTKQKPVNRAILMMATHHSSSTSGNNIDERETSRQHALASSAESAQRIAGAVAKGAAVGGQSLPADAQVAETADVSGDGRGLAGRYHLYISYACPWASRCYATLKLKGLEDAIGVTVVKPKWEHTREGQAHMGWAFATFDGDEPGCTPDPINGAKFVRDLYEKVDPTATKYSVPVLWDKKLGTMASNDSAQIMRMFNADFNEVAKNAVLDLYPSHLQGKINEVNDWINKSISTCVYRCGWAKTQKEYDENIEELFAALDRCEELLSHQRFLVGDTFTEADVKLFVALVRFDEVYVVHFKCNKKALHQYPNLFNFTKDVYQIPLMADTVNMYHIKKFYYASHLSINPTGIIPIGPSIDFSSLHNRHTIMSNLDSSG